MANVVCKYKAKKVPTDEMLLAESIAESKAAGHKRHQGSIAPTDDEGNFVPGIYCVLGSIEKTKPDIWNNEIFLDGHSYVAHGNDGYYSSMIEAEADDRYTFGQCWYDAMEEV